MFVALSLFAILVALIAAPAVAYFVVRSVLRAVDAGSLSVQGRVTPIEDRLTRIEEAIDAMAQQIERLTEQQRALLGAPQAPNPVGEHDVP